MSEQNLKLIENHIKDLLFKNVRSNSSSTSENSNLNYKDGIACLFDNDCVLSEDNPIHKNIHTSSMELDCSSNKCINSSQLIDLNVLTDFAAKHADVATDMISDSIKVLPHPELESDLPNNSAVSDKNTLSVYIADKSHYSPACHILHNPDSMQNTFKNYVDPEVINKKSQRKNKKSKKQLMKQKMLCKTSNHLENGIDISISPNKISHKQENIKRASFSKSAGKTAEKQNEIHCPEVEDSLPSKAGSPALEEEYSLYFPKDNYKFICHLCKYEAKSKDVIHKHLKSDEHKELKKQTEWDKILPYLPEPLPNQTEAISKLLFQCHTDYGLQNADLINREKLSLQFKEFIACHLKGCNAEMIGSSSSGLGLKTSRVDFVLKVHPEQNVPDSLEILYENLRTNCAFSNVESDFKKKRPGILFKDVESDLNCHILIENGFCEKFCKLMSVYRQLDPRVHILGTTFRYWAQICGIDNQDRGTLPAHSFSLLLIYFLQQVTPPVLPVLHEMKEYSKQGFFEECIKEKIWKSENDDCVGELWIKLFYFYNFTYVKGKHVVCIRNSSKVLCSDKNWSTKFYAIEDPFVRRNIAHVIPNFQVCHYIDHCFLQTYQHFAYPRLRNGEIKLLKSEAFETFLLSKTAPEDPPLKEYSSGESTISEAEESCFLEDLEDHDPDLPIENMVSALKDMCLDDNSIITQVAGALDSFQQSDVESPEHCTKLLSPKKETKKTKEKLMKPGDKINVQNCCSWDIGNLILSVAHFLYKMDAVTFRGKKDVPFSCKLCKSPSHLKKNCPNDELPQICQLPEMTPDFLRVINKVLKYVKDKNCVDDEAKSLVKDTMLEIENHIQKHFPEASLNMFGSFCNGFGFKSRSDMDFCLTFKDKSDIKDLDCTDVIENVASQLRQFPKLENIIPVTTAKVPIVKFSCTQTGLEGDISLYNALAIANTELLEAYSRIDSRVQILGFALKYFAKVLGICDASRGSLSSYAYILMVIYFLQQRQPPVIPVLQELHAHKKTSETIDEWNVWFFKEVDKLPEIWSDYNKNQESVGELWLGLLSFYAYEFDWKEYVVSIRQKALLTRFRKLWITDQIAIEDPFDLNHNLGAGLSRKMNMYILKAFVRGRERFGTPLSSDFLYSLLGYEVSYLFDRRYLNSGCEPPHDRGCRICGKIGHFAKNCTLEKSCSCCKQVGHLVKNCPQKKKQKKAARKTQDMFPAPDNKNRSSKDSQSHPLRVQSEVSETYRITDDSRKLMQMGYSHHHQSSPGFLHKTPPGFKTKLLTHQNGTIFSRPLNLSSSAPFPRTLAVSDLSQSPPKHSTSSPPKNYQGNKQNRPSPDQVNLRGIRPGLLLEPPIPLDAALHRIWSDRSQLQSNQFSPQYLEQWW